MHVFPPCFNAGDTIYFPFDSYDSNGASVTISGLAVTDIEVYKNGSITQRASDNGYTLLDTDGIDFDGTIGLHGFSIDTSDNSDAGFWSDGAQYWVNVNAITVDSQTVRFTYFLALGYTLRPTTAGRKLDVSAGGEAGIDWNNIGSATTTVNLSGTTIKTATDVETDTADIQTRLPAALVGGRIDANMGAISTDATAADNLEAALDGTGGVTITAGITGNVTGNLSGSVGSVTGNVGGNVTGSIGSLATQAKADVNAEVDTALVDVRLDELLAADSDIDGAAPPTVGSVFHELMSKSTGSFTFDQTTDSLEALRDRGDSAWITATGFSTLDAAGVRSAVGLASANLDTQLADIPTVSEFNARTLAAADYFDPAADTVANVTTVATLTGHTPQTGDAFARLGAPAGASIAADIADVPTVAEFNARTLVAANYSTASALSTAQTAITDIQKIARADMYVDTATTPWALVHMEAGTGGIGVGTELMRQNILDVSGVNITVTTTVVGQLTT